VIIRLGFLYGFLLPLVVAGIVCCLTVSIPSKSDGPAF
jgi:hypothetical protein